MRRSIHSLLALSGGLSVNAIPRNLTERLVAPPRPIPHPKFEWGSVGDSWCSGVAYNYDVEYDDNADSKPQAFQGDKTTLIISS